MPGYAAMLKGLIMGSVWEQAAMDGETWKFTVNKYGNISGDECANVGPEFNPLAEFVYGQPNKFADPSRGTILDVVMSNPDGASEQEFKQKKFMQNLGGKNSIIGKAIRVTRTEFNPMT